MGHAEGLPFVVSLPGPAPLRPSGETTLAQASPLRTKTPTGHQRSIRAHLCGALGCLSVQAILKEKSKKVPWEEDRAGPTQPTGPSSSAHIFKQSSGVSNEHWFHGALARMSKQGHHS